jgi:hypothetical protein
MTLRLWIRRESYCSQSPVDARFGTVMEPACASEFREVWSILLSHQNFTNRDRVFHRLNRSDAARHAARAPVTPQHGAPNARRRGSRDPRRARATCSGGSNQGPHCSESKATHRLPVNRNVGADLRRGPEAVRR